MNASELMARCLENEGVRHVFGVPGEENLDLLEALHTSSIRFITTRHEQGAAFMANVWGRLSGEAGVCLATLGPGATHLDLPEDVAQEQVEGTPLLRQQPFAPEATEAQIARAARILAEAKAPIVLAGNGVIRGRWSSIAPWTIPRT